MNQQNVESFERIINQLSTETDNAERDRIEANFVNETSSAGMIYLLKQILPNKTKQSKKPSFYSGFFLLRLDRHTKS
jgi:hypothetical protein